MENFELKAPKGATKKKTIVGRGDSAGKGSRCGKGDKGQNARSGGGVRPGFEGGQMPIYRRVARRGFSNYPFKKEVTGINLFMIAEKYSDNETVNHETLVEKGIVKKSETRVKILGEGEIAVKVTIDGIPVSASARQKIEKAGGKVTVADVVAEEGGKEEKSKKEEASAKKVSASPEEAPAGDKAEETQED